MAENALTPKPAFREPHRVFKRRDLQRSVKTGMREAPRACYLLAHAPIQPPTSRKPSSLHEKTPTPARQPQGSHPVRPTPRSSTSPSELICSWCLFDAPGGGKPTPAVEGFPVPNLNVSIADKNISPEIEAEVPRQCILGNVPRRAV